MNNIQHNRGQYYDFCKKCGTRVDEETRKNHQDHDVVSSFAFPAPKIGLIDWNKEKVAQCGKCWDIMDAKIVVEHFNSCESNRIFIGKDCQHNWTYYDPTPGRINAVMYPHGAPVHQICVTCHKKRIGSPQPIRWEEVTNES